MEIQIKKDTKVRILNSKGILNTNDKSYYILKKDTIVNSVRERYGMYIFQIGRNTCVSDNINLEVYLK